MEQKELLEKFMAQVRENFEKAVAAKKAEDAKKEEAVEEAPVEAPKKRGRKKKAEETAE